MNEQSWEQIFDIMPYRSDDFEKGKYVQATFWEIRREYVKDIKEL